MFRRVSLGPAGAFAMVAIALMVFAPPWPNSQRSDPPPLPSSLASARTAPLSQGPAPRTTVSSIPVGDSPTLAAYDPFNGYVYVVNSADRCGARCGGSVSVLWGGTEIARLAIGGYAMGLLVDPQDGWVYVSSGDASLTVLSQTRYVGNFSVCGGVTPEADALAFDRSSGNIYLSCAAPSSQVVEISGTTVIGRTTTGAFTYALAYDDADGDVYALNTGSSNVSVISGSSLLATLPLPSVSYPENLLYDPVDLYVYSLNTYADSLTAISGTSVVGSVTVGQKPWQAAVDASNGDLYVVNNQTANVSVVSGVGLVGTVPVGQGPDSASFDPDLGSVFVANFGSANLSNVSGSRSTGSFRVGIDPTAIAFDVADGDLYVANYGSNNVTLISFSSQRLIGAYVTPPSANVSVGASTDLAAHPACSGGSCLTGTTYAWSMDRALGTLNSTTGPVVQFTAGSSAGTSYLFVNATLNGVTVQSASVPVTIASNLTISSFLANPSSLNLGYGVQLVVYASGGKGALTYTYTGLPPGCATLNVSSWICTPTATGSFAPRVYVNDTAGSSANATTSFTVSNGGGGPPPQYTLSFAVFPTSCGPVLFNGSTYANGASASFRAGTYPARAFPCGGGWTFQEWVLAPVTLGTVQYYYTPWANISVSAQGYLSADYLPPPLQVVLSSGANTTVSGAPLTLTPFVSGGVPPYTCVWALNGTNTTRTGCSATSLTWGHPGNYTYRVWVTDASYQVGESNPLTVQAIPPPPLTIGAVASSPIFSGFCGNDTLTWVVQLSGWASGAHAPYRYAWNFGDASPDSSARIVNHTYAPPPYITGFPGPYKVFGYTAWFNVTDSWGASRQSNLSIDLVVPNCPTSSPPPSKGFSLLGLGEIASLALLAGLAAVVMLALAVVVVMTRRRRKKRLTSSPREATSSPTGPGAGAEPAPEIDDSGS